MNHHSLRSSAHDPSIFHQECLYSDDFSELEAEHSSPPRTSSPDLPRDLRHGPNPIPFNDIVFLDDDDTGDGDFVYTPSICYRARASDSDKARVVLKFMKESFNAHFSFRKLLETIFTSEDKDLKIYSGSFYGNTGHIGLLDLWWDQRRQLDGFLEWIIKRAAEICAREASMLTDRASEGPHYQDALFLRTPATLLTVDQLNSFKLSDLTSRYDRITPNLQQIFKAVIGKGDEGTKAVTRNPNAGRTMATSIVLNMRSRKLNYHAAINTLILWDNRVPKRLTQAFNQYGITMSYAYQADAIVSLSANSLALAQDAAQKPSDIRTLVYDNFNWASHAWEVTALHRTIMHDQVSALLIMVTVPQDLIPDDVMAISSFIQRVGTRHKIPATQSLTDILPTSLDQQAFRLNSISHVGHILCDEIQHLAAYRSVIPRLDDTAKIEPKKTQEYYLPTFDQEQGSTRGNMVVLEHYFGKVLNIPKETFDNTMFGVLGDRLTTTRDRAAQDQRSVDRSESRFDRLSSFSMLSGLMHVILNFLQALGRNMWGTSDTADIVSLSTIRDALPNRSKINPKKIDYYAWLRFFDVILRSLVVRAAIVILDVDSPQTLVQSSPLPMSFTQLCISVVDRFLTPSLARLEANGHKLLPGMTKSGQAILLFHNLMTVHEMQDAIKHGHPTRIQRMIKYWCPMYYAAGSYNYANECMELLHNLIHDWPKDFAALAFQIMLVNPSGRADGFKATDLRIEHLNAQIKERAHGSNATPGLLEKITPVMGHIQRLTDELYEELGVERQNQRHAEVSRHADVVLLSNYLTTHDIFNFRADAVSKHEILDLYLTGCRQLAGEDGGHAKHLRRHQLRLRNRYSEEEAQYLRPEPLIEELEKAADAAPVDFTVQQIYDDLQELLEELRQAELRRLACTIDDNDEVNL